jgi:sulfate permease, SulP family
MLGALLRFIVRMLTVALNLTARLKRDKFTLVITAISDILGLIVKIFIAQGILMAIHSKFNLSHLRGDIFGGLTAAVVALPLALAFGVQSGAGPIAGLYGAIFVGFFAALFGGTKTQVSGPTGPMTVVMAGIFIHYVALDPINGPALAFTVVMMAGALQILFGFFKIGKYINYVPQPIISGFMSGIGIIIIILQLGPLLGHAGQVGTVASLLALPSMLVNINWYALILALFTLAIVYFTPQKIARIVPSPLLALIFSSLLVYLLLPADSLTILGEIPTGLPTPTLPSIELSLLPGMLKSAFILAMLGSIDSLLTSLVADNITRTHHDSERELMGQGLGNMMAGLFSGLPGAGATMRTMINVKAGGTTVISGALHALILLAVVFGLGGIASYIPHVVLAGILIKVGTDIIDWQYLKRVRHSSRAGVMIMFIVLLMTVFVDLILAVAVGMVVASLIFVKRQSDLQFVAIETFRNGTESGVLNEHERYQLATLALTQGPLYYHFGGALSFGIAKAMIKKLALEDNYQLLILDFSDIPAIDYSASKALEEMIISSQSTGHQVFVINGQGGVQAHLLREKILLTVPEDCLFDKRDDALQQLVDRDYVIVQ